MVDYQNTLYSRNRKTSILEQAHLATFIIHLESLRGQNNIIPPPLPPVLKLGETGTSNESRGKKYPPDLSHLKKKKKPETIYTP